MNAQAKVLSVKIIAQYEGIPVKCHNLKMGKITGSHYESGQILMDLSINKRFVEKVKKILSQPKIISVFIGDEKWLSKNK